MRRQDCLRFARLAWQIARTQVPDHASNFAPIRYTQPARLACLCLQESLHLDSRGAEALLASAQELRAALEWHAVPDHSTLWWCSRHTIKPRLLARVLTASLRVFHCAAAPLARTVAVDSTGFARAPASPSSQLRAGTR